MRILDFNILSEIEALYAHSVHGPLHRITITGTTGYHAEMTLRKYHVKSWGRRVVGPHRSFLVRREQAKWACHILDYAGIPILEGRVGKPMKYTGKMPKAWTSGKRAGNVIERLRDLLAHFA